MSYICKSHIVSKGQSLSSIAFLYYRDANLWREIYAYNNHPEVYLKTGRRIANPDRIAIGQVLMIPIASKQSLLTTPSFAARLPRYVFEKVKLPKAGNNPAEKITFGIPGEIDLANLSKDRDIPLSPNVWVTIGAESKIVVQVEAPDKGLSFTEKSLGLKAEKEIKTFLGDMVINGASVKYDLTNGKFSADFSCGLELKINKNFATKVEVKPHPLGLLYKLTKCYKAKDKKKIDDKIFHYVSGKIEITINVLQERDKKDNDMHEMVKYAGFFAVATGAVVIIGKSIVEVGGILATGLLGFFCVGLEDNYYGKSMHTLDDQEDLRKHNL